MKIGGLFAHVNKPEIASNGIKKAEHVDQGNMHENSRRIRQCQVGWEQEKHLSVVLYQDDVWHRAPVAETSCLAAKGQAF
jgi:hypothetical protein